MPIIKEVGKCKITWCSERMKDWSLKTEYQNKTSEVELKWHN